jgi:hypothetical protein
VDPDVLTYYKDIGLFESLNLSHVFKESVGASYDKILYLPALMDPKLAIPKFKKYSFKNRNINYSSWDEALNWTFRHYSPLGSHSFIKDYSLRNHILENNTKETLMGSAGLCYTGSKYDFIEDHFDIYLKQSLLFKYNPVSLWRGFLKDELREGAKVLDEPSSRLIWGSSVILFIAQYKLFKILQDSFIEKRHLFWSSCGLDFSGSEYGLTMSKFADRLVCSVDGSSFDANMQIDDIVDLFVMWDCFIDDRFKDESYYDTLSFVMSNDIFSCVALPTGIVAFKECGNPSGSYLTLMRNTFHNFRLYAYVYIQACKKYGVEPRFADYINNHYALMNGDDCIITSSRFMNWSLIKEYMSPFLNLTSVSVDGKNELSIFEVDYCGCKAVLCEGNIVPIRNATKMLLSLLFLNESSEKLEQRCWGLILANPFDDFYVDIITGLMKIKGYSLPDISFYRSNYFYKEVVRNESSKNIL